MPLVESIERRIEPRDTERVRERGRQKSSSNDFDLSKVYFVARHIPLEGESRFKYVKLQGDRMVHAMLEAHVNHCLHRMVFSALQDYDGGADKLAADDEMERFVLHLVRQKVVLVSEQMLGAFSILLREERLKYPHGSKELAEYIVRYFNKKRPLTKRVMAVEESGEVVIKLAESSERDDCAG